MDLILVTFALVLAIPGEPLPIERLQNVNWQHGLRPGEGCPKKCQADQCPVPERLLHCPAGRVRDGCGCCWECGNGEGQLCDPDSSTRTSFYGRCTEGLRCRVPRRGNASLAAAPKAVCMCARQEVLCGTDGKTYENVCQIRDGQRRRPKGNRLEVAYQGPCKAKPVITIAPRDAHMLEGSDVIFACEVSSFPVTSIQWRREGDPIFMPADESNMAMQAHGGQKRFELTGWLQIQGVRRDDEGVYTCTATNAFGQVSASARLQVVEKGPHVVNEHQQRKNGLYAVSDDEDIEEDYENQSSGLMYM
ncbi:kazal-type serine peptidase inhibitor domain 2 [Denticeps clupeoides]|uniref:kazal-type serine peptidase inhibitor domain 2 n=1 Tax=Denticeps clupeoides TaxID=299321 RepID=UPI0010A2C7CE|nr:kazal-type serine protease inhibitor domain-containing protein 1-like [Denticeps clupeoides]